MKAKVILLLCTVVLLTCGFDFEGKFIFRCKLLYLESVKACKNYEIH